MYGKSKIEDLEKDTKVRVMDVSEVGHAFDLRLLGAIKVFFFKGQKISQGIFQKSQNPKMNTKSDLKICFGSGFECCWECNFFVSFSNHVSVTIWAKFGKFWPAILHTDIANSTK